MSVGTRARRSVQSVGELTELFGAAIKGAVQRRLVLLPPIARRAIAQAG